MATLFAYKRTLTTLTLITTWIFFFPFFIGVNSSVNRFDDVLHNEVRRLFQEQIVSYEFMTDRLNEVYKANDFKALWIENGKMTLKGSQLVNLVQNVSFQGLLPKAFPLKAINGLVADMDKNGERYANNLAVLDVLLSASGMIYLTQIKYGIVKGEEIWSSSDFYSQQTEIVQAFFAMQDSTSVNEVVENYKPEFFQYRKFEEVLKSRNDLVQELLDVLSDKTGKSTLSSQSMLDIFQYIDYCYVDNYDEYFISDEVSSMKKAYLNSKFYDPSKPESPQLAWYLLNDFQKTLEPLVLNFDRLKQYPVDKSDYVWVNIPSYKLEMYESEYPIEQFNVIVGGKSTPTPVLTGSLRSVVAYPTWSIPRSITVNEVLPAIKRNSNYLAKKGYGLQTWQGERVNPDSVAWENISVNNMPFVIVQPAGNYNALGVVKFTFDNDQNIYLHDTNARGYFNNEYRALSHGCIRLQEPEKLAGLVLNSNQHNLFISKMHAKSTQHIKVTKDMDVYLRYLTCEVKIDGTVYYYRDIYEKDDLDLQAMHASVPHWN